MKWLLAAAVMVLPAAAVLAVHMSQPRAAPPLPRLIGAAPQPVLGVMLVAGPNTVAQK